MSAETGRECRHLFQRHGRAKVDGYWLRKPWWKCVHCGFETRSYDGVDRMAMRPIHPHMSVAVRGFNTAIPTGQTTPTADEGADR